MIASHRFPTFNLSERVDPDYLLMLFQSDQGRALMLIHSPGAAGRNKTIRLGEFLAEEIRLPSIPRQLEIVQELRHEQAKLQSLEQKIAQAIDRLTELKTALVLKVVTGKIDVRKEVA